jgi:hypothetical protein
MSNKTTPKAKEPTMSKTLDQRIAEARAALSSALTDGRPTGPFREFVRELEAEQRKEQSAAARQQTAQQARADEERQRINEAAKTLLEARNNRVSAIASRFAVRSISDTRLSSHA